MQTGARLGGDENGLWMVANSSGDLCPLSDSEFRINLRMRVGLRVMEPGLCQHRKRPDASCRDGKRCLQACDPWGIHAVDCMAGGGRVVLHNQGCEILHQASRSGGLAAQREVVIPELRSAKLTEPRVDVEVWGHPGLPRMLLDFTVRKAGATAAGAAARAEADKASKYGQGRGGTVVTGVAMETSGRHGPGLDAYLRMMAGLARSIDKQKGQQPRHLLAQWRMRLSITLARFVAAAVLSARTPAPTGCGLSRAPLCAGGSGSTALDPPPLPSPANSGAS